MARYPNKALRPCKSGPRDLFYHFWRNEGHGDMPLDVAFFKRFGEIHGAPYDEAFNTVTAVMVTLQDMLLTHKRFMLPGIGPIGLAENPRTGINVASSTMWWTPGLLNVLAVAPGWENAPLNGYLTSDLLKKVNRTIARLKESDRKILSPYQFYAASDFSLDEDTNASDDLLKYFEEKAKNRMKRDSASGKKAFNARESKRNIAFKLVKQRLSYLEGLCPEAEPFNLEDEIRRVYDQLQVADNSEL